MSKNVLTEISEDENESEEKPSVYKPNKVFINHVDNYNSKYIAAYISDQIHGATKILGADDADEQAGEEAEGAEGPQQPIERGPSERYEFIGTLSDPYKTPSEDILGIIKEDSEEFREEVLKCGYIIYDISNKSSEIRNALKTLSLITEELDQLQAVGPKTYENFHETKTFILISLFMTWGLTKPLDPNDPSLPFSEIDYRKRRPHPNYKQHYNCEKEVIKIGQKYKQKLKTYVLCSGMTYGEEEHILEFYFKMAWYNEILPIFDAGNNKIPFIHIRDLAKALHGLMEFAPPKPQYILAVEQTPTNLKQFVKSLSKTLSDGKTKNVVAEEAFLYKNMSQTIFERCTVNLNMEPVFLVETLQVQWQSEMNIAENMNQIVEEFRTKRNLKPVKIILHGPPGSGKTSLANKLCDYYNFKYVSVPTMLEDFIQIWKESMVKPEKSKDEEEVEDEMVEEEEEEQDLEQILEQIRETQIFMEGGIEKIPDDYISGLLKSYLSKNFCQNRGYVLDDYPRITAQAKELFGQNQEQGGEEEEVVVVDSRKILPDLVVSLIATDEVITKNVMKRSEEEIKDTSSAEENFLRRLEIFRENNADDNTVLNYFDELEIDILLLELTDDHVEEFDLICRTLGPPPSFGLTPEEENELRTLEEKALKLVLEKEELDKQIQIEKAEEERKDKMEYWSETLEKLQMEEEKLLVARSEPLRHYLMKFVFPVLTKGLIEVATLKPDDPVDYLAEFLFKENPEGKIFDPSYNAEYEALYGEFKGYIEDLIEGNEAFEK